MTGSFQALLERLRPAQYARRQSLVLINGLAEQAESWYRNHRYWSRFFEVHTPNLLQYEGEALHRRIEQGQPITVDYLVEQLYQYLDEFVQTPPYHLVASSLGGKIAIEFAVQHPQLVSRIVLLCPSGMGDEESLPVIEGVRRSDMKALVDSVFADPRRADPSLVTYYRRQFGNRRWRMGLLRTIRGTMDHVVRGRLSRVSNPTLLVSGQQDRIVCPEQARSAAADLPRGHFLLIPGCGHAPQIEKPWLINRLVVHFLTHPQPSPRPPLTQLLLAKASTVP
jgi:pimeloyl-ACP methyl ester carboxylesterase